MSSRHEKIGLQSVARLQSGETLWDTEMKRFGVRRRANRISYFVKAQIDRRQRWITIGQNGPMTPSQARAEARRILGSIDAGQDPTRDRDDRKRLPTFDELVTRWLAEHVELKRKKSTAREYRRLVDRHLRPHLGKTRVDRIERADVMALHASFARTRYAGNRAIAVLSSIMTFAERLGYRPPLSNPCRGIERFKEQKRKRPLTGVELNALWTHLKSLNGAVNPYILGAIRLLILTGMRREEVLTLRWSDVDLTAQLIRLTDAKTGPRDVVLSSEAAKVLEDLPRADGHEFVFVGQRQAKHLVNISETWRDIRQTLGFPEVRIHDLRHTIASVMAKSAPLVVVRDALGHSEIATTSDYSHAANEDVRQAVDAFAKMIAGAQ
jgi:integrase